MIAAAASALARGLAASRLGPLAATHFHFLNEPIATNGRCEDQEPINNNDQQQITTADISATRRARRASGGVRFPCRLRSGGRLRFHDTTCAGGTCICNSIWQIGMCVQQHRFQRYP